MKFIEDFFNSKINKEKLNKLIKTFSINEYMNNNINISFSEKLEIIKILNDANIRNDFFFILNEGLIKFKNKEIKKKFKDFILGIFNEKIYIKEEEKKYFQDLNLFMFNYFFHCFNLFII